jgi:hypothetical protein
VTNAVFIWPRGGREIMIQREEEGQTDGGRGDEREVEEHL